MRNLRVKFNIYFPICDLSSFFLYDKFSFLSIYIYEKLYNNLFYKSHCLNIFNFFYTFTCIKFNKPRGIGNVVKIRGGSTRKIRCQKGTGRARIGSSNSPVLKGGRSLFVTKKIFNKKILCFLSRRVFFNLLLNKRSNIFFVCSFMCVYSFNTVRNYIKRQLRLCGV